MDNNEKQEEKKDFLPCWRYWARKYRPKGKKVSGTIHAYTLEEVIEELKGNDLFTVRVELMSERTQWALAQKVAVTHKTFELIKREHRFQQYVDSGQLTPLFPKKKQ